VPHFFSLDDNHKNKSSEQKKTPFRFGQNVIFFYYVLEEILNEVVNIKFSSKVTKTVFDGGFFARINLRRNFFVV
jgi:hypothetical protein